ncbi:hypothetical protein K435DRAFT_961924 [Dendrothele bispora CBS 962.96]|uniref:Nephrocystin 3-like N-terminal domain-containing protein n=1 Tax=Dendrothele bispora (strain CBS 962.96) TaxID=1314807 RepID=A0A4S8MNI6_DENBC|nr:hypothetical protein K435DRAFT_961924 [Dendrothele bispora CBS 962.96]
MNTAGGDQHIYYSSSGVLDIEKVIKWLDAPDPSRNYVTARDKRVEETGMWLLNHSQFIQWKETGHLFWLQGKAGSGKTFLCTNVITQLQNQGHQVFYYYFDTLGAGDSKNPERQRLKREGKRHHNADVGGRIPQQGSSYMDAQP